MTNKVALIILDGWGIGKGDHTDAIAHAETPYFDSLVKNYPNSTLKTFGRHVGLPVGQMGNSEVGHLNIGAGRIVYQELSRINHSIEHKEFFENTTGFHFPVNISKLKKTDPKWQYTFWHNSFFNPSINENIEILNFSPIKTGIKIIN